MQRDIRDHTIILDIDGVLMADAESTIDPQIASYIATLKEHNDIFIVSNSFRDARCAYAAEALGLPWIDSPFKKPSVSILNYMQYDHAKPMLVIGDKLLTDGIFALRIGAEPVMLHRRTSPKDRIVIKLTYLLDDIAYSLVRLWYTR